VLPVPENPALTEEERAELQRLRAEVAILRLQVQLRPKVDTGRGGTVGVSSLTTAELRLLPLLFTHLTFPEIGERLYVSRHTVKTQALSVYRKLGASSRSQAVQRAQQLGLGGLAWQEVIGEGRGRPRVSA
jgi:LuxR family transcriptional regulator, maltose regulon positive regulatory protein